MSTCLLDKIKLEKFPSLLTNTIREFYTKVLDGKGNIKKQYFHLLYKLLLSWKEKQQKKTTELTMKKTKLAKFPS